MNSRPLKAAPRLVSLGIAFASAMAFSEPMSRAHETPAYSASANRIAELVGALDADTFADRESATLDLLSIGAETIEPLLASLATANLEPSNRALHVLRELAGGEDEACAAAARGALVRAAKASSAVGKRAEASLREVDRIRRERAENAMEKLGAIFENTDSRVGLIPIKFDMRSLSIGPDWKGGEGDWKHLQALHDVERITLEGERIDDGVLARVAAMPALLVVTVKRAKITPAGLGELIRLPRLQQLEINYTPIGDEGIEPLAKLGATPWFRLFGTRITPEAADRLHKALPAATIDYRQGAFLGVGCGPHVLGCQVTNVHPGSAAEKGGLMYGDVIVRYNGEKTPDFEALTKQIAANAAGDTVAVEILRDGEKLERKVTLGEWE
jgi:hypothetical protein